MYHSLRIKPSFTIKLLSCPRVVDEYEPTGEACDVKIREKRIIFTRAGAATNRRTRQSTDSDFDDTPMTEPGAGSRDVHSVMAFNSVANTAQQSLTAPRADKQKWKNLKDTLARQRNELLIYESTDEEAHVQSEVKRQS